MKSELRLIASQPVRLDIESHFSLSQRRNVGLCLSWGALSEDRAGLSTLDLSLTVTGVRDFQV
jgi:hypothetical protein